MTIVVIIPFLLVGIFAALRSRTTLTSPLILFCLWFLVMFGFYDPFTVFFNTAYSPKLTLVLALGTIATLAGLLVLPHVALSDVRRPLFTPTAMQLRIARLIAVSYGCYSIALAVVNLHQGQSYDINELYSFSGTDSEVAFTPVQLVLYKFLFRPMLYSFLVAIGFLFASSIRDRLLYVVGPVTLYSIANLTQYGGRGVVLQLPVVCVLLWCHLSPKREMIRLLVFGTAALVAFFMLQLLRHGHLAEGGVGAGELVESVGTGGEWEPIICLSELIDAQKSLDVQDIIIRLGDEAYFWLVNWVPRGLWADKPETDFASRMSYDMYGHLYSQQAWVRNFTYIGQGYYLAAEFGVVLIGFLFGAAVSWALYITSLKPGLGGVYCFLLYEGIYLSRDCFTTWLFDACAVLIFALLINRFLFGDKPARKLRSKQATPKWASAAPAIEGLTGTKVGHRLEP